MRKASLGTLFLTVFLDLLGFGLVVPFLPGVARAHGASDLVATLLGATYSAMQFLFIPLWGRLSDRVGRRPVLLWSIGATAAGMTLLGLADSLAGLFLARLASGIATANIAVAQAYIADITPPENRARGMGLIGMGFGLGFIFGPFIGGELGRFPIAGREGALAAFVAAGLSVVNFFLAAALLPESHPAEHRAKASPRRAVPLDPDAFRAVARLPGTARAVALGFLVIFWFAGLEQTFRLFTEDAFRMSVAGTGRLFAFLGIVGALVQGLFIQRLARRYGEPRLLVAGSLLLSAGFAGMAASPGLGAWGVAALFAAAAVAAVGSGLHNPSLSSYVSRQAGAESQGASLGVMQSMGALARVAGPVAGGLLYQTLGARGPYAVGALGMLAAAGLAATLPPLVTRHARPLAHAE